MRVRVVVSLKNGVLDPQGQALKKGLHQFGFGEVQSVHVGKVVELEMDLSEEEREVALQRIQQMCEKLLVNEAVETYRICKAEVFQ
ncbi:MAG: phosphoribosylformylglycinamidine synthase subunit PurS [Proteobacteria bacterium]|nr:phosphoribosylformylglycinamidine synthase subunit PurS [Cystobacterineae bacterium]MCL2259375.1 phosphoribosylformylglycinamidine synthase subunit PurS [Cystobacterineae bacterium]MCL2314172.1 phosphoribosylformylglycinamidine synthase subunit PurS [Pseudomonadota bacterium]